MNKNYMEVHLVFILTVFIITLTYMKKISMLNGRVWTGMDLV